MAPGGATFGRLREVYGRNDSESIFTPVLAREPVPFVTVSLEMVGGTALRKEANQTPVRCRHQLSFVTTTFICREAVPVTFLAQSVLWLARGVLKFSATGFVELPLHALSSIYIVYPQMAQICADVK